MFDVRRIYSTLLALLMTIDSYWSKGVEYLSDILAAQLETYSVFEKMRNGLYHLVYTRYLNKGKKSHHSKFDILQVSPYRACPYMRIRRIRQFDTYLYFETM